MSVQEQCHEVFNDIETGDRPQAVKDEIEYLFNRIIGLAG